MFKKGDIAAKVTTTQTHYGFGTGRAPTTHHSIEIIRVAGASRDGFVKSYQTTPKSPVYKHHDQYGRTKFLTISGEMQANAARLFEAANDSTLLRFDDQETVKAAILRA